MSSSNEQLVYLDDSEIENKDDEGVEVSSMDIYMQDDADLEFLQSSFDKLTSTIVYDSIDANNLKLYRVIKQPELDAGPGLSGDGGDEDGDGAGRIELMKIASLEGFGDMKETTDYVQLFRAVIGEAKTTEDKTNRVNESLINYFALLGGSQDIESIDFDFVESLTNVADLNSRDIHGQTIMHEVAREWSTDIAKLLLLKGMNIDLEDGWGRTPLFVAVASNHVKMVKWLIENGADINHRSMEGEGQTPIHYAAKHNSVEAFQTLMDCGASPLVRDDQDRTPFFVAAHSGHQKMCKYLLDMDLPTVSYASNGEATIDHILDRLPNEMATQALNQFVSASKTAGKCKIYLSCLGKRRWKLLSQHHFYPTAVKTEPPGPLEIILARMDNNLIMHPAILTLIKTKTKRFAAKYIYFDIFLHCLFTLLWSLAVALFKEDETWYSPNGVIILTFFAQVLTCFFMFKFYRQNKWEFKAKIDERERVMHDCFLERKYCHPRWRTDQLNLERDIEAASTITYSVFSDGWNLVEVVCLAMSTVQAVITFVYIGMCGSECASKRETPDNKEWLASTDVRDARMYMSAIFILVVWVRLNVCFRFHQKLGPFIAMLAGCFGAFVQIGFLFFEFFIPFAVACWVLFGGAELYSEESEYILVQDLIYQVYLLTIVGDYEFDPLPQVNKLSAQLFVGVYALVVSIITINLYIGLLSESYSAISATASARAYLQEAISMRRIEMFFPEQKLQFEIYINKYCAPMIADSRDNDGEGVSARVIIKDAIVSVGSISVSMRKITEDQESLKKDIISLNDKFRNFELSFSPDKSIMLLDDFEEVRKNEEKLLVRFSKNTDKKFNNLVKKIKDFSTLKL